MQAQLITMLTLQDSMNARVHPEWRTQGFAWYRAIWVECGELLDHYGWKWWKKQTPDMAQVQLELIDIWHFGLSIMLQSGQTAEAIASDIARSLVVATDEADFRLDLERFTAQVLATQAFDIAGFGRLMAGARLDFEQLFSGYVGKNVLNFFRQDHGYQDGTYHKIWHGREDNEHLVDVLAELDHASPVFKDDVYRGLEARYPRT